MQVARVANNVVNVDTVDTDNTFPLNVAGAARATARKDAVLRVCICPPG
jgi:hypothetical protein